MALIELSNISSVVPRGHLLFGLDVGETGIGIAVSDLTWTIATPVTVIKRLKAGRDREQLRELIAERQVGGLIVGLPIEMSGREGSRCQSVRAFVRNIDPILNLPVAFWDERLSTVAVERVLTCDANLSRAKRSKVVDRAAATWILQGALDRLSHQGARL